VVTESNKDNPLWEVYTPEEFKKVTFENDEWEAGGHWVAERAGKIIGYGGAKIFKARKRDRERDGWLGVWIVPKERARGVENEIVMRSLDYLREKGMAKAKYFDLKGIDWRDTVRHDFGFAIIHREFFMVKKDKELPELELPEGLKFRDFLLGKAKDKQLKDLKKIANDAFAEDKNYAPNTMESLRKWRDSSPNIVRINFAVMKDKVVGVCISEIELEYNKVHKVKAGWTRLFGVAKDHRNMHIGKALLHDGMRWQWDQGMDTLYVGKDEMNPPAERVYRSVGFEVQDEGAIWSLDL
jgi:GNAT superfamily N-acetyltransferase